MAGSKKKFIIPHKNHFLKTGKLYLLLLSVILLIVYWIKNTRRSEDEIIKSIPHWLQSNLWTEDKKPHVNPHVYAYLHNQPDICQQKDDLDLLIMVSSSVGHFDRRRAIRSTWASQEQQKAFNFRIIFLMGQGYERQTMVEQEFDNAMDIVQEDFKDSYGNLTLKTVMGLKWASIFCPSAKFVMKTDDDIFVNVPVLINALRTETEDFKQQISGCIKNSPIHGFQPIESPSNSMPFAGMPPAHPLFTAGAGYVLPGKAVSDLYISSLETKFFPVEDVFTTAHCAKRAGWHPPRHDTRFSCGQMTRLPCEMSGRFTGHKVNEDLMFSIWESRNEILRRTEEGDQRCLDLLLPKDY